MRRAARALRAPDAEAALARLLDTLSDAELAGEWEAARGAPPPSATPARLLRLGLAYDVQAAAFGGLKSAMVRRLDRLAGGDVRSEPPPRPSPKRVVIKPGATLVRDWRGRAYRVEVGADGCFSWDGRRWGSLSAIARTITGTSRNGPAFFGLREEIDDAAA